MTARTAGFLFLGALTALTIGCGKKTASTDEKPAGPDDKAALQGKWVIVKVEVPPGEAAPPAEAFKDVEISVRDNLVRITKGGEAEAFHAVFTLDGGKSPKELDLTESDEHGNPEARTLPTGKGKAMMAIYKLDGETLVIAAPPKPGEARPTEFQPTPRTPDRKGGVGVVHLKKQN
jgi:uncharacterized protein (TIGR03067 family)